MSDGDELMIVVRRDNKTIIDNINNSVSTAGCAACPPLKAGSVRTIELLEMVLERGIKNSQAIASNTSEGRVHSNADRTDAVASATGFRNILQIGNIKAAGIPAMILAGVVGFLVFQYYQTEKIKTFTKETIEKELKIIAPSKTVMR